jgi:hypothetical protein
MPAYDFPEMLLPLLTVLSDAQSLKVLKVSAGSRRADPHSFFLFMGLRMLDIQMSVVSFGCGLAQRCFDPTRAVAWRC